MKKKKKGLLTKLFEFQAKPLKILVKETVKGIKEGLEEDEARRKRH